MKELAIVAIPNPDDYVWKLSSVEIPHMTLMILGDAGNFDVTEAFGFISHAAETSLHRFGMDVERRGILGDKKWDVLFFGKHNRRFLEEFRAYLLTNPHISTAYNLVPQFPVFIPHLSLGNPDSPAKPDTRDFPGVSWVNFNRLALWTGDFEGPEVLLTNDDALEDTMSMSDGGADILDHHGVKGMRWGVRKDKGHEGQRARTSKIVRLDKKFERRATTETTTRKVWNGAVKQANASITAINNKPKYKDADFTRDTPLRRAYYKEGKDALVNALEASANSFGTNASGTKKYGVIENHDDSWDVVLRDVKHADSDEERWTVLLKKDETGHILSFAIQEDSLAQSEETDDILEHFGIRGMKWGVRKDGAKGSSRKAKPKAKPKPSADHNRTERLRKKKSKALSNDELATVIKRKNLETQYSNANPSAFKKGQNIAKAVVGTVGTISSVIALASSPAGKAAITAAKAAIKLAVKR